MPDKPGIFDQIKTMLSEGMWSGAGDARKPNLLGIGLGAGLGALGLLLTTFIGAPLAAVAAVALGGMGLAIGGAMGEDSQLRSPPLKNVSLRVNGVDKSITIPDPAMSAELLKENYQLTQALKTSYENDLKLADSPEEMRSYQTKLDELRGKVATLIETAERTEMGLNGSTSKYDAKKRELLSHTAGDTSMQELLTDYNPAFSSATFQNNTLSEGFVQVDEAIQARLDELNRLPYKYKSLTTMGIIGDTLSMGYSVTEMDKAERLISAADKAILNNDVAELNEIVKRGHMSLADKSSVASRTLLSPVLAATGLASEASQQSAAEMLAMPKELKPTTMERLQEIIEINELLQLREMARGTEISTVDMAQRNLRSNISRYNMMPRQSTNSELVDNQSRTEAPEKPINETVIAQAQEAVEENNGITLTSGQGDEVTPPDIPLKGKPDSQEQEILAK